eukprot:3055203-Rhodomonas_salina.5
MDWDSVDMDWSRSMRKAVAVQKTGLHQHKPCSTNPPPASVHTVQYKPPAYVSTNRAVQTPRLRQYKPCSTNSPPTSVQTA